MFQEFLKHHKNIYPCVLKNQVALDKRILKKKRKPAAQIRQQCGIGHVEGLDMDKRKGPFSMKGGALL